MKSSNKNSQELTLVQEADPERRNRRIVQVQTAPDHRWCYVAALESSSRLYHRGVYIFTWRVLPQ